MLHEFLSIAFSHRLNSADIFGGGIFDEIKLIFAALFIQSVACAHIFELNCGAYVAGLRIFR